MLYTEDMLTILTSIDYHFVARLCICFQQTLASLAFSIVTEVDMGEPLNFIAPSETDFHMWTDGINSLLGYTVIKFM